MDPQLSDIRQRAIAGIRPGDRFVVHRTFAEDDTLRFGELTRDANPVHYESAFAKDKGFASTVLHGLLTGSMLCEVGGQIGWLATGMSFSFIKPVYPGDTITCTVTLTEVAEDGLRATGTADYVNQHGELVLQAELEGHLPSAAQRQLMSGR